MISLGLQRCVSFPKLDGFVLLPCGLFHVEFHSGMSNG